MRTMALVALTGLLACGSAQAVDRKWVQDRFEIGAWIAPPPGFTNNAAYAQMAAAGFTLVTGPRHKPELEPEANIRWLDLCKRYGIRGLVRDARIKIEPLDDADRQALAKAIADYRDHPALYGYFIKDEPGVEGIRALKDTHDFLAANDPEHLPYINLFPVYGGPNQLEFANYEGYIDQFVRILSPLMVSFDHYTFRDGSDRTDLFRNLEITRDAAIREGIPLWFIVQALDNKGRYRKPTLNQMYWQVNCALVYGARSIFYFPYWSGGDPAKPQEWNYLGVILPDGRPNSFYAEACEINPQIKRLGPLLMKLTSQWVMHLGEVPPGARAFTSEDLVAEASGDQITIGRFADKAGLPVLMLVNRDWDNPGTAKLRLEGCSGVEDKGRIGPGQGQPVEWDAGRKELSVTLAPGEGRVIRVTG